MAAGAGTRFAGPHHKLLSNVGGQQLWQRSLDQLIGAGLDHVVVITGALLLDVPAGVTVCHNDHYLDGQATSLQVAVDHARSLGVDAVVVGLADQPFVQSSAWRAVADAPPTCAIAVANYSGVRGPNPVRIASTMWHLLPTRGDEGARSLIRAHPELVCDIACLGSVADIDTLEDFERWKNC